MTAAEHFSEATAHSDATTPSALQGSVMTHLDDDFEFIQTQAHETDDLSSLTSNSGETDNESESDCFDSQAQSNVTLRMPSLDEISEDIEQKARNVVHSDPDVDLMEKTQNEALITPNLTPPKFASSFDIKPEEFVTFPILYFGPDEYKRLILQKLARELSEHFTEDVWESERYSIAVKENGATVFLDPQSRISLQIVSNMEQSRKAGRPLLIIGVLESTDHDYGGGPSRFTIEQEEIITSYVKIGVPFLPLLDHGISLQHIMARLYTTSRPDVLLRKFDTDEKRIRALTLTEFTALDSEQLSRPLMQSLDAWHHARSTYVKSSIMNHKSDYPSLSQIGMWAVFLMVMAYSIFRTGNSANAGLVPPGNWSATSITFHQITETTALIEMPLRYRSQPRSKLPEISATVSRDGKVVTSRVQLIVDNLYSLDWPQSEAHGELVFAAELKHAKEYITEAYIVQYSSKTPLLNAITEKLQKLRHIASDVEYRGKVQEIMRQVEEKRSYVIKASHEGFESFRAGSSNGFKKMQEDCSRAVKEGSETFSKWFEKGSKWTGKFGKAAQHTGVKSLRDAQKGLHKLQDSSLKNIFKHKDAKNEPAYGNPFLQKKKAKKAKTGKQAKR